MRALAYVHVHIWVVLLVITGALPTLQQLVNTRAAINTVVQPPITPSINSTLAAVQTSSPSPFAPSTPSTNKPTLTLEIVDLKISASTSYLWEASSKLVTPSEITVYTNRTASTATYSTSITRKDPDTTYTIVGSIAIASAQPAAISGALILLGGLPPSSEASVAAACPKGQNATDTVPLICPFAVELALPPSSITAQARRAGNLSSVLSATRALTFGPVQTADSGANCVALQDSITAGAATKGLKPAGVISPFALPGVTVCNSMPVEYSINVGPFADGCGTYQVVNSPKLLLYGRGLIGNVSGASPATLTVAGCSAKNVLGVLKPALAVTKLVPTEVTQYTWAISSTATPSEVALQLNSTAQVEHVVTVERIAQLPTYRLTGEVTITNTQTIPYSLAGIRLAWYTSGLDPRLQDPTGYINVTCLGLWEVIVPPQVLANQPGTAKCSFDVPEPTGKGVGAVGGLVVQGRTFLSNSFDMSTDVVDTFDFGSDALARSSVGGCASLGASYLSDTSEYMASAIQPSKIVSGSMPKLVIGLLASPVCGSKNFTWVAQYGPANVNEDTCGDYIAVNNFRAVATTGPDNLRNFTGNSTVQLRLACSTIPTLQISTLAGTGFKNYSWSTDISTIPSQSVDMPYNKQNPVNYTMNFVRQGTWANLAVAGTVTVINPGRKVMRLMKATWVARGNGTGEQQPVEGVLKCPRNVAGAFVIPHWQDSPINGTVQTPNYIRCTLDAQLQDAYKTEIIVTVTTVDGLSAVSEARPIVWDVVEKEQCARQFSYFEERPSLFPFTYNGSIPGPEATSQVLCKSEQYNFTALFGPYTPNSCMQKKVVYYAGYRTALQSKVTSKTVQANIVGCPAVPLPAAPGSSSTNTGTTTPGTTTATGPITTSNGNTTTLNQKAAMEAIWGLYLKGVNNALARA